MKITIKKTNQNKNLVKEKAEQYLMEMIGHEAKDLSVVIRFRKMACTHLGSTVVNGFETKKHEIIINSILIESAMLKTLAHECTHVKQVYLSELAYKRTMQSTRRGFRIKAIRVWKGREIKRCAYYNRPWEIEARAKAEELTKTNEPIRVVVTPKPVVNKFDAVQDKAIRLLRANGSMTNVEFYANILSDIPKAEHIQARKSIFKLKTDKIYFEYMWNGVVKVLLSY